VNTSVVKQFLGDSYAGVRSVRGGVNGSLYVAYDQKRSRKVFIKLVDGKRYRRELNVFALAECENVVSPLDTVFVDHACCALIYPWFRSGSLRKWLSRRSIWSAGQVKRLAYDLLEALGAVHAQRMLHGDIKPENILVQRDEKGLRFLLSDFGSSAYLREVERNKWRSATPAYEAPESAIGQPTAQSDLFSLGVVLFEAVTGSVPYQGMPASICRQARYTVPSLSDVPCASLRSLLSRLLQNDKVNRPENAHQALELLSKDPVHHCLVLPRAAAAFPKGLAKRHVQTPQGNCDSLSCSDDGRYVAFQAGCNMVVHHSSGRNVGNVTCSNVPPVWFGGLLYFVKGADVWRWDIDNNRMNHVRWMRHIPDAIAVNCTGEAWLRNRWLFYAGRGSDSVKRVELDGFLSSEMIALHEHCVYVVEGNFQNHLVCRDRDLKPRWSLDLEASVEGLKVSSDGALRVLARSLSHSTTYRVLTFENGIRRHCVDLDSSTRRASLTRRGCIAWLATGQIRLYAFNGSGRIRADRTASMRFGRLTQLRSASGSNAQVIGTKGEASQ
jgi:serine/threonine protein kinase